MTNDPGRTAAGGMGEYAWRNEGEHERSMADVLRDIFGNVQEMIRSEIRLARVEIRNEAGKTAASAKVMAIGGVVALFGAGFLLVTVAQLLALVMPAWAADLIVGVVLAIVGSAMLMAGKKHLTAPTPHKTIETVKENVEWMKNQTR